MMQLCSLVCIVCLWWTSTCFGARVDAPNAGSRNFPTLLYPPLDHTREGDTTTGLTKLKEALAEEKTQKLEPENSFATHNTKDTTTTHIDIVNSVFRETKPAEVVLGRRLKRSYAPEAYSPADRRFRRLVTWKRRPYGDAVVKSIEDENDDYFSGTTSQQKSSYQDSGSLIYLVSSDNTNINNNNNKNSLQKSEPVGGSDKKDCSETFSSETSSAYSDAPVSATGKEQFDFLSHEQPVKRVDRSLPMSTSDMLASAGQNIARNFMKRRRGGRMYDVPQIECPRSNDRMERFACPSPDFRGRFRCIDDRSLCDGFFDCPGREDENPDQCLFYKTTKAHLDILAEALLRWARGR